MRRRVAVIACTTVISTQVAVALPRKIQPRLPGASASAVIASFSSSVREGAAEPDDRGEDIGHPKDAGRKRTISSGSMGGQAN